MGVQVAISKVRGKNNNGGEPQSAAGAGGKNGNHRSIHTGKVTVEPVQNIRQNQPLQCTTTNGPRHAVRGGRSCTPGAGIAAGR